MLLFDLVASVLSHTGKIRNKIFHGWLVLVLWVFLVGWLALFLRHGPSTPNLLEVTGPVTCPVTVPWVEGEGGRVTDLWF